MNLETNTNGYQAEGTRVPLGRALQPLACAKSRFRHRGALSLPTSCPVPCSPPAHRCQSSAAGKCKGFGQRVNRCL